MQIQNLIRDASKVHDALKELPDSSVVAVKDVTIYIPTRFVDRGLAYVGVENHIVAIYAIVVDDMYYGVSTVNAMITIDPTDIGRIKINNDQYFEFTFKPGATVFKSTNLVKSDVLTYKIYDEILSNGNVPWYLSYEDLGGLFDTAKYHAGANIGQNKEVTELIASIITRDPTDKTKYYRSTLENETDLKTKKPVFIGLKNVVYSATNTVNRLGGSYFSQGVVAALVNPAVRKERIEQILLN